MPWTRKGCSFLGSNASLALLRQSLKLLRCERGGGLEEWARSDDGRGGCRAEDHGHVLLSCRKEARRLETGEWSSRNCCRADSGVDDGGCSRNWWSCLGLLLGRVESRHMACMYPKRYVRLLYALVFHYVPIILVIITTPLSVTFHEQIFIHKRFLNSVIVKHVANT